MSSPFHLRHPYLPLTLLALLVGIGLLLEATVYGDPQWLVKLPLVLMALACFYEPFLKLIGMARWQEGTHATLDVPWIALVGYPT